MKTVTLYLLAALAAAPLAFPAAVVAQDPYEVDCGNDGDNDEDDPDCEESGTSGEGANPVQPYKANLKREVTDITTFGEAPIVFTRYLNSRTVDFNDPYWELGARQVWQHNWNFEVRQLSTKTNGFFDIKVRYPKGDDHNFKVVDTTGTQLSPPAHHGDRLYRWSGSTVGYTLITPDGKEYDFKRTLSPKFQLTQVRNGLGYSWSCTYDATGRLARITNNFGRWLQIDRETGADGVLRINRLSTSDGRLVTFQYSTWPGTGKSILTEISYPGEEETTHSQAATDGEAITSAAPTRKRAAYSYVTANPNDPAARPLLESARDPKYKGAGSRTKYVYNYSAGGSSLITGTVLEERNAVTDQKIVSFPLGGGRYPKIVEGDGVEVTRKYANGLPSVKADAEGRAVKYTRDSGGYGFVSSKTDAKGTVTNYIRDHAGRVLTEAKQDGKTRQYAYSPKGFKISETDELNRTIRWTRDESSRVTRKDYPDGTYEGWTYNSNGQATTHRDRKGSTESFAYNGLGEMTSRTDATGKATNYTYHPAGLLATATDPRGFTTSYTYDSRGQVLTVVHPDSTTTRYAYNEFGNRTSVTNELNQTTSYTYDEYNRVKTTTDPLNRTMTYEYGLGPGCGPCSFASVVSRVVSPGGRITEYQYDRSRLRTAATVGAGTSEASTTRYEYDASKNLIRTIDGRGKVWQFGYDDHRRKTSSTDPLNQTTRWTYDDAGNKISETQPDGRVTRFRYDSRNRVIETTNPLNQVTRMTYDGAGNLLTLTDAKNNTYTFAYDSRNRRISTTYPDGSVQRFGYDAAGNLVSYTTRAGQVQTISYDNRKRPTATSWSDGTPGVTIGYDIVGRIIALNNSVSALSYSYDNAGQLLSETQNISGGPGAKTIGYTYDADGQRTNLTYPGGMVAYAYNARKLMSSVSAEGASPLASYGYDGAGNRISKALSNGTTASYAYDDASRLSALTHRRGSTIFASANYGYDAGGNRTSMRREDGKGDVYAYDEAGQIQHVRYGATNPDSEPMYPARVDTFTHDAVGNRVQHMVDDIGHAYTANNLNQYIYAIDTTPTYDANGNMWSNGSWNYQYDAQNRLVLAQETVNNGWGPVLDGSSSSTEETSMSPSIAYFGDDSSTHRIEYDARNRPVKRTSTQWGFTSTTFLVYDAWNLVAEFRDNKLAARYVHGAATDELLVRGPTLSFHHQDALGSTIALTDANSTVTERYTYEVFGTPTFYDGGGNATFESPSGNRFLFTGREYRSELGLYDYRYRCYSPSLGRFLQSDPLGFGGGDINLYRYVNNRATMFGDPAGLFNPGTGVGGAVGTFVAPGPGTVIGAGIGTLIGAAVIIGVAVFVAPQNGDHPYDDEDWIDHPDPHMQDLFSDLELKDYNDRLNEAIQECEDAWAEIAQDCPHLTEQELEEAHDKYLEECLGKKGF